VDRICRRCVIRGGTCSEPNATNVFALFFAVLLAIALSPLLLLKYLPPLTQMGLGHSVLTFVLPLGISFFTFHAVSYLIDVKRGSIAAETRAHDYFLYLFYFPHQIAGPIVRYSEIVDDIKHRPRPETSDVVIGLSRFCWGLAKKALVADPAGTLTTTMCKLRHCGHSMGESFIP